jgi:DNA-binding MarR family transcriptional regulator
MLVVLLTGWVNSINTVRMAACGFRLHRVSVTGHGPYISSAKLKLSHTEGVDDGPPGVSPELARHAGELRVRMSRLARRLRREDRGHSLTMSQQSALSRLDHLGATTLSELAAEEHVRPQSMARTLDSLEAARLVGRAPHPTDRRQNVIRPTDLGRAVIAETRIRREAWLARAMASVLSSEERDLLVRAGALMDRLAEYAAEPGEPDRPPDSPDAAGPAGPTRPIAAT